MHGEIRLDRIVGRTILPSGLTKNFALAQRANDPSPLFSPLTSFPRKAIEAKGFHMAGNLMSETVEAWRSVISLLADRRQSRAATREFWAMGLDECTGILNDIGLSRSEFDEAMRLPYASQDLLSSAMRSIDIDPDSFQSLQAAHRFMSRICITCQHRRQCHGHLAAFDFESHYQDFCPNSVNFADLQADGRSQSIAGKTCGTISCG
ncbi:MULTISPECIES: hypothetical protein [unclassified Mesorhizobium]|uniref:hypothetical protein n=1 Tax=unclassified Mesorhizobium TaxID=325217 RepID=UPI001673A7DD|nr:MULTISPECIES: hypothetical protein [unclassified Mesorhizobium]